MSKNLDLLLVNVGGTRKKVYQELSKDFCGIEPPSWAALTAGFIRNHGFEVDIIDANADNLDIKETADYILKTDQELTGIVDYGQQANTATPLMTTIEELCREIKMRDPDKKVIITAFAAPSRI